MFMGQEGGKTERANTKSTSGGRKRIRDIITEARRVENSRKSI